MQLSFLLNLCLLAHHHNEVILCCVCVCVNVRQILTSVIYPKRAHNCVKTRRVASSVVVERAMSGIWSIKAVEL
jgi:hypothetical protein